MACVGSNPTLRSKNCFHSGVENFASAVCGECGAETALFHEASAEQHARTYGVEVIGRIPFDPALARAADADRPFVAGPGAAAPAGRALAALAQRILGYPAAAEGEA